MDEIVTVAIIAPSATERAALRELAAGPACQVVAERPDFTDIPSQADVVLVSGDAHIARAFEIAGDDGRLGVVALVLDVQHAAALAPDVDVAGWSLLGRDATRREVRAAVVAAAAGLAARPASWTLERMAATSDDLPKHRESWGRGDEAAAGDEDLHDATRESLTLREREVLALLAEGFSNRVMADQLGISEHTVKFHVAAIYGKLGVSGRAAAVRRALARGLIHV